VLCPPAAAMLWWLVWLMMCRAVRPEGQGRAGSHRQPSAATPTSTMSCSLQVLYCTRLPPTAWQASSAFANVTAVAALLCQ
jgi:hypothetical protein